MRNVHKFDWSNGATIDQEKDKISYLVDKLQQDINNPLFCKHKCKGKFKPLIAPNHKGTL